jgi:hypothetical protein
VLREHQLYEKLSKCLVYQRQIHYLSHIISEEGIVVDPENIRSIEGCLVPNNVSEMGCFMGLVDTIEDSMKGFQRFLTQSLPCK